MTLRGSLGLYLALIHLVAAVCGAGLLWAEHRSWILALEAAIVCSLVVSWSFLRALKTPADLVQIGSEWIKEGDFSHTFKPAGTPDLTHLIELFNTMFARLRDERIRLREQNLFLDKVMTASPSGILTTDHNGHIDLVNPAATHLLDAEENSLHGLPAEEILPEATAMKVGETLFLHKGGNRRLRLRRAEFFDRGFPRSLYLIEDLTLELWASEKRAYHTLIRTMTHEVNNTLGATGSILRSALAYGVQLSPEDSQDFAEALNVAMERGGHLVEFMKRYAEVVKVPSPLRRAVDLAPILRQMQRLFEPDCENRNINLRLKIDAEPAPALIDTVQIEQVVVNVLQNAIEAVEHDGWIQIRLWLDCTAVVVEITDSGPGLDPEARRQLFTPFFSTKPDGQGVGLTLVREILTLHGADFSLDSTADDPTCFSMRLAS